MKAVLACCLALIVLGIAAPADVRVPQAQINAENAHWKALGVHLPPGGIVLAHPYAPPFSNRSFIVPWSWYAPYYAALHAHRAFSVNAAALRADLPTLRLLMQKTYAGYAPAQARGWKWNAWFARWGAMLQARGHATLSLQQAFAPWGQLERVQLDNHSGVPGLTAFVSGSVSAILRSPPAGSCAVLQTSTGPIALDVHDAGQQPHAVQRWNGSGLAPAWYISYPRRDGIARSLTCGSRHISLMMGPDDSTPAQAAALGLSQKPTYAKLAHSIAYVRMPTFSDANDNALETLFSKHPGLAKDRVVLLDLRGNGGGNAPSDLLNTWFAESAIENAASLPQTGTRSCFRTALFFNLQQQLAHGLKPSANGRMAQLLQSVVDPLRGPSNCSVEEVDHQGMGSISDHVFTRTFSQPQQTRVIAIVDNGCGSDCEYMVSILAQLPGTVIAGTSTYGVMGFTQPGYFVLPNSRVPFRLALSRTDAYGDGRSVDGYGITVDVLLPTRAAQSRASLLALARTLE